MTTTVEHTPGTTQRETKLASELTRGDWIRGEYGVTKVTHAEAYDANQNGRILVVTRRPGLSPDISRMFADSEVEVATDAEITDAKNDGKRTEFAEAIGKLINRFDHDRSLPVPYSIRLQGAFFTEGGRSDSELLAEARALGRRLGVEPTITEDTVTVRAELPGGIEYVAYSCRRHDGSVRRSPEVNHAWMAASGDPVEKLALRDRAHGEALAENAVRDQHHHAGGSGSGPGENGADCKCGIGFYGFDSQDDALAALNPHIAAEIRKATTT